jgi:hypothetical protein
VLSDRGSTDNGSSRHVDRENMQVRRSRPSWNGEMA